ncbi:MAG: hypothetical protein SGPRY_008582, partial [Prymnesium sp.]
RLEARKSQRTLGFAQYLIALVLLDALWVLLSPSLDSSAVSLFLGLVELFRKCRGNFASSAAEQLWRVLSNEPHDLIGRETMLQERLHARQLVRAHHFAQHRLALDLLDAHRVVPLPSFHGVRVPLLLLQERQSTLAHVQTIGTFRDTTSVAPRNFPGQHCQCCIRDVCTLQNGLAVFGPEVVRSRGRRGRPGNFWDRPRHPFGSRDPAHSEFGTL